LIGQAYRTIDGSFNNTTNIQWGASGDILTTITTPAFDDGISQVSGTSRPNAREISNYVSAQSESISSNLSLSDYLWSFGQFIDHDIVQVESDPFEPLFIKVPEDDQYFTPGESLLMFRSEEAYNTGSAIDNPRQYENKITAFIDASTIYGSDKNRADWLRTFENGKLKTSNGNLLPWNTVTGEFNDAIDRSAPQMEDNSRLAQKLFVAGDMRANENPLLISLHTLFVREHNRICDELLSENVLLSDEELYQTARRKIGAYIQSITYNEWLPAMGVAMPKFSGYRADVNPQISNVFSAAAFRLGHTLINSNVLRMKSDGNEISQGNISLKDAFFNPLAINLAGGIEPYLRGMAQQVQQELDPKVVDDLRNFLFSSTSFQGMDLAAVNITRGRERGLGDFNSIRKDIGLPILKTFEEFTENSEDAVALKNMFGDLDSIDPWVGMLAEKHMPDAILGNTLMLIIERQFQNLRDGDRFYYENDPALSEEEIEDIKNTTLQHIIMRNSDISAMQDDVFRAMDRTEIPYGPELAEKSLSAAVFPNPNNGSFKVKIFEDKEAEVTLKVYNSIGRIVSTKAYNLSPGDNFLHVDIPESSNTGFYNILIEKEPIGYTILRMVKN